MHGRGFAAVVAVGALTVGLPLAAVLAAHDRPSSRTTSVLAERQARPATGLSVSLTADRTTVRPGQTVHFTATWRDDDGRRTGWSTLTGDEGAAKYVRPGPCTGAGRHPDSGRLDSAGSYARPGTYAAYVEIVTGGCGAATETQRAVLQIRVTAG